MDERSSAARADSAALDQKIGSALRETATDGLARLTAEPPTGFYVLEGCAGLADVFLELGDRPMAAKAVKRLGAFARSFPIGRPRHLLAQGRLQALNGTVIDVIHDSPAYKAGIGPGMKIVAVNGAQYSSDAIRDAIGNAKNSTEPLQVITSNGARIETRAIDYHRGNRYPHIVRDETHPDYLSEIYHGKSAQSEQ